MNAKQLQVVFSQAVSAPTSTTGANAIANYTVGGTNPSTAALQADGKTVILTFASATTLNGVAQAGISNAKVDILPIESATDSTVLSPEYATLLSYKDTIAPTIVSTTKVAANTYKTTFSEPISTLGNITYKLADGTDATGDVNTTLATDGQSATFVLSGVAAGKTVTATILGALDEGGNLLNPNPATISLVMGDEDGVAPTVSSITPTGLSTFNLKFSEQVQGVLPANIKVDGTAVASAVQDTTDPTEYVVTTNPALTTGLHTVSVAATGITDLSGEPFAALSKVVSFTTVAPNFVSSNVQKDTLGNEYLYLTFDKAVAPGTVSALTATEVKNYVTTTGTIDLSGLTATDTTEKVYKVELSAAKFTPTGASTPVDLDATGSYAVTLTGGFEDLDGTAIGTTNLSFVRGTDAATLAQTVSTSTPVTAVTNNDGSSKVHVTFDQDVDAASATNAANYQIAGVTVSSATVNSSDLKSVYLTIAAGSNTLTGARAITISGVKTADGVTMASAYTGNVALTENVAPTITAASLTAVGSATSTITLTFSKAMTSSTLTDATTDVDVYIGGVKYTGTVTPASTGSTTATLTLNSALTADQLASGVVVKADSAANATDTDNNALSFTSINVAQ